MIYQNLLLLSSICIACWSLTRAIVIWWSKFIETFLCKKAKFHYFVLLTLLLIESCWFASWVTSLMFTNVTLFNWPESCKFELSRSLNNESNATAKLCNILTLSGNTKKTWFSTPSSPFFNAFVRNKEIIIYLEMAGGSVYRESGSKWRPLTEHAVTIDGKWQWARQWVWYSLNTCVCIA